MTTDACQGWRDFAGTCRDLLDRLTETTGEPLEREPLEPLLAKLGAQAHRLELTAPLYWERCRDQNGDDAWQTLCIHYPDRPNKEVTLWTWIDADGTPLNARRQDGDHEQARQEAAAALQSWIRYIESEAAELAQAETSTDLVGDFLRHGEGYFSWDQLHRLAVESPALMNAFHEQWKARAMLLTIGRKLAPRLEAAGHDSTPLLTFLHAIDAAGGPEAAAPLWAPVKVTLQRLAIREGLPQAEMAPPAANLGRERFNVASWPLYPFGDRPQRLPTVKTPGLVLTGWQAAYANQMIPPPTPKPHIDGTPTPGGTVRLERDGVAVELYFPTDADRATFAAALPSCDLDNPPWHAVQARLVSAGLSADWASLTAPAAVALLARPTTTAPSVATSTPGTGQSEGAGTAHEGDRPPAPGGTKPRKTKPDRPPTKCERLREQRLSFCRPRRRKDETWDDIYTAYRKRFPQDKAANRHTLRLTFERWEGKYSAE